MSYERAWLKEIGVYEELGVDCETGGINEHNRDWCRTAGEGRKTKLEREMFEAAGIRSVCERCGKLIELYAQFCEACWDKIFEEHDEWEADWCACRGNPECMRLSGY